MRTLRIESCCSFTDFPVAVSNVDCYKGALDPILPQAVPGKFIAGGMPQHLEIERKFLVKSLPRGWQGRPRSKIAQGYLPCDGNGVSIRIRKKNQKHLLTIKAGRGRRRFEEEINITKGGFDALWPLTKRARVRKVRHEIPLTEQVADLDIYEAKLRGLTVVEIEFDSERASRRFEPPPWLGREVTADPQYANESLARSGKRPR